MADPVSVAELMDGLFCGPPEKFRFIRESAAKLITETHNGYDGRPCGPVRLAEDEVELRHKEVYVSNSKDAPVTRFLGLKVRSHRRSAVEWYCLRGLK